MEKENVISIWIGNFESEEAFAAFIEETFDEDGDMEPSPFMKAFEIEYINPDFQEVLFQDNLSKDDLLQASYAESFIDKLDNHSLRGNSIVILYDFCYVGEKQEIENFRYLGSFDYRKN